MVYQVVPDGASGGARWCVRWCQMVTLVSDGAK
jgi:hypothetical protein